MPDKTTPQADKSFRQMKEEAQSRPEYWEDLLLVTVATSLDDALLESETKRTELSERAGVGRARVTKVLSGEENLTLRTMAALAFHLGKRWKVELIDAPASTTVTREEQSSESRARDMRKRA